MKKESCKSCKYFHKLGGNDENQKYGNCIRFPQTVDKHNTSYCGEYKSKTVSKKLVIHDSSPGYILDCNCTPCKKARELAVENSFTKHPIDTEAVKPKKETNNG